MKKLILLLLPLLVFAKPKFNDADLKSMTPQYFQRNHSAPKLLGVNIYQTRQGRVFQIDIRTDRNRSNEDMGFTYSALTNMGQYAKKKFSQFIVVMHSDIRGEAPQVCVGKAKCSIDTFIHNKISYEKWYKDCFYFKEL
jgi:hypothetical protein